MLDMFLPTEVSPHSLSTFAPLPLSTLKANLLGTNECRCNNYNGRTKERCNESIKTEKGNKWRQCNQAGYLVEGTYLFETGDDRKKRILHQTPLNDFCLYSSVISSRKKGWPP